MDSGSGSLFQLTFVTVHDHYIYSTLQGQQKISKDSKVDDVPYYKNRYTVGILVRRGNLHEKTLQLLLRHVGDQFQGLLW